MAGVKPRPPDKGPKRKINAMKQRILKLVRFLVTLLPVVVATCQGQVRIDLRTQSKSVDFGGASRTRPFQTGGVLPSACQEGDVYYLTTAPEGQNVHLCQAAGQWAKIATAAAAPAAGSENFAQPFIGVTSVTLAHNSGTDSIVPFCVDLNGDAIEWNGFRIVDGNTAVVTFSTAQSGRCIVNRSGGAGSEAEAIPAQAGQNGRLLATNGVNSFWSEVSQLQGRPVASDQPQDGQALMWSEANGRWEPGVAAGGSGVASVTPGTGIVISGSAVMTVGLDVAVVPTYLTTATSLTFAGITNGSCQTASMTLAGALDGDSVAGGWPNTLEAGLTGMMLVTAPDIVTVRLCNHSGTTVTPSNQTYRATIVRTF